MMKDILLIISLFFNIIEFPHLAQDLHTFAIQHNFTSDHSRTVDIHI